MKRLLSFLIVFVILFNSLFVICYADDSSFVTKAIASVKEKIDIPVNYKDFNSKLTFESGTQNAYFTWSGDADGENSGGQINVTVDEKSRIISFSQYFYGDFSGNYKLSQYSSDDAKAKAIEFLPKAFPEFYDKVKLIDVDYSVHRKYEPYELKFVRYVNNLPCYDNYIDVKVDAGNGEILSADVCWVDYDKIYPSKTLHNIAKARVDMFDNIGMVKEYATNPDGRLYVRYADLSDGINYINAYTGNLINTNYVSDVGTYKNALSSEKTFDFWLYDGDLDFGIAEYVVLNNSFIPLDSSYSLVGYQYLQDNYGTYVYLEYMDTKGNTKTYIVDSEKGDVRYYNFNQQEIGSENLNLSSQKCRDIADLFVLGYESSFIDKCDMLNYNMAKNAIGEDVYYFNYTRYINDIAYDKNGVVVGVSRSTGNVVSVVSGWENITVPEYSLTVSPEQAFTKYLDVSGFELQYVSSYSMTRQMELRLVYAPDPLKDYYVDAVTGRVIDAKGDEVNTEDLLFVDIGADISKEQIITLYNCGIFDGTQRFNPNEYVTLCDYLLWMCRAIDCVEYKSIWDVSDKLIMKGIVSAEDLILNIPVNTEMGIKYMVSYLGYDYLASLTDTYQTGFVDEGMISPELIGYAAIAKGLKIFEGNAFLPKENMKRNVAAQIIYNLISN